MLFFCVCAEKYKLRKQKYIETALIVRYNEKKSFLGGVNMNIKFYVTDQDGKRLEKTLEAEMQYKNTDAIEEQGHPGDVEPFLVNLHPDVEFQSVGGIGGAFTDT